MANLILLNVKKRVIGSVGIINEIQKSNNTIIYNPTQQFALDILDLATPIRANSDGTTYFGARSNKSQPNENRNVGINYYTCTDSLTTIAGQSAELVKLTVLKKDFQVINSELMIFQTGKIIEIIGVDPATSNTRFQYLEDGAPNQITYEVLESPATIVAAGASPVFNMNGRDLYVNDLVGNNSTAEKGNPLLPWATVTAALAAAVSGDTVVILEGSFSVTNAYKAGVNIELRSNATLTTTAYNASTSGNQTIYGGGHLIVNNASGMILPSGYSGNIKIDVGTAEATNTLFASVLSTSGAHLEVLCDYSIMGATTEGLVACSGNGSFDWNTHILHTDNSTGAHQSNTFSITASSPTASVKVFNINITNGTIKSCTQGGLKLAALDATYVVNLSGNIVYTGEPASGTVTVNSLINVDTCTGGALRITGAQSIVKGYLFAAKNSHLNVRDESLTNHDSSASATPEAMIAMAGGSGSTPVNYYCIGVKRSNTGTASQGAVLLGDSPAHSVTGGTDTFIFKGGLRCQSTSANSIGILVSNSNDGLIVDGGSIEMNDNALNESISAASPHNMRVYGTGFVKGVVNGNLTNIIAGSNIVQDANVVVMV